MDVYILSFCCRSNEGDNMWFDFISSRVHSLWNRYSNQAASIIYYIYLWDRMGIFLAYYSEEITTRTGKLNEDKKEQSVAGVGHTQSGIFLYRFEDRHFQSQDFVCMFWNRPSNLFSILSYHYAEYRIWKASIKYCR